MDEITNKILVHLGPREPLFPPKVFVTNKKAYHAILVPALLPSYFEKIKGAEIFQVFF